MANYQIPPELYDMIETILRREWSDVVEVSTPATAGSVFVVQHGLGKVPSQYIVTYKSGACDVYDAYQGQMSTPNYRWTNTSAFFKATAGGVVLRLTFR